MGLPPPLSSRSYNQQIKKLACKSVTIAEKVMSEAAEQLFKIVEEEEPTKIEVMQDGTAFIALLMQSLGVTDLGSQTLKFFRKENKRRIENMKRKSSAEFKARRKELRMKKKDSRKAK
eukprot:gene12389-3047_t